MNLELRIYLPFDVTREQRHQEMTNLRMLFGENPQQLYRHSKGMSQVQYYLYCSLDAFPTEPQIDYLQRWQGELTWTPNVACARCTPVTGQLIAVQAEEGV